MHAVHFWGQERAYLLDVTEKERRREGKSSMGPRMKYGHANQKIEYAAPSICIWAILFMICVSIFHPRADATFPLSPPFFFLIALHVHGPRFTTPWECPCP